MVGAVGHTARRRAIGASKAIATDAFASFADAVIVAVARAIGDRAVGALPAADTLAHPTRSAVAVAVAIISASW